MVGSASAITVSINGTNFVTDTFEDDTVGSPAVADTGTWTGAFGQGPNEQAVVTNAGTPGPANGSQYLVLDNPNQVSDQPGLKATGGFADTGDVLSFRSMVYLDSAMSEFNNPLGIRFSLSDTAKVFISRNGDAGNTPLGSWHDWIYGTDFAGPSGLLFDTWQEWRLDYTVGATTATLTVAGTTATAPARDTYPDGSGGTGMAAFEIWSNKNNYPDNDVYLDDIDVPEPATLALLVIGGCLIMRRRP